MGMLWNVQEFRGLDLSNATYTAFLDAADNLALGVNVSSKSLKLGLSAPMQGALTRDVDTMTVTVIIKSSAASAMTNFLIAFDETNEVLGKLIATDDGGTEFFSVMGRPIKAPVYKNGAYKVVLEVPDKIWTNETPLVDVTSITTSGQVWNIPIGGSAAAQPIFEIVPVHAKGAGGWDYAEYLAIINPGPKNFVDYPFIFKTLNTMALVGAGKMLGSGDDLILVGDGKRKSRWLIAMNSSATKIKGNLSLLPAKQMTLSGTIASSGPVPTINTKSTDADRAVLTALPARGKFLIKTGSNVEIFTYTSRSPSDFSISGITRAQRFTSEALHNDGDTIHFLEHDFYLYYGAPYAGVPLDDGKEPVLDSTATNTAWVQNIFRSANGLRTGGWKFLRVSTLGGTRSESRAYTGVLGASANPASEMGSKIASYILTVPKADTAEIRWSIFVPGGITNVLMTGKKKRITSNWLTECMLKASVDGVVWHNVWAANETAPALNTLTNLNTHNDALGGTYYYLMLVCKGSSLANKTSAIYMEIQSVTLTLASGGIPNVIYDSGEQSHYLMDGYLRNVTTQEGIYLKGTLRLSDVLTIDCAARDIYTQDGKPAWEFLDWDSSREAWMDFRPNAINALKYIEAGVDQVDITTTIAERRKG